MAIKTICYQQTIVTTAVHQHLSFNIPSSALTGCDILHREFISPSSENTLQLF